ncbi:hypothetical protein [Microbacterium immunditiarum]|uniref:Uncharacterized protein n=1 Tax=Microbacterium immunditiarum TaxID=337480 RepID=A0A7Y9GL10_9MICO|nr:hypothetical protein [Microbacterium immunditiarum]NYE18424.1 hypothetical protein [Microbacterium immunditiarum]
MSVVLFAPVTFNLAETTRMIEVARALDPARDAVFTGYEDDFVSHHRRGLRLSPVSARVDARALSSRRSATTSNRVTPPPPNARPKYVSRPEFVEAVRRVLTDPAIRKAADEVREAYAHEDGAARTARLVEASVAS